MTVALERLRAVSLAYGELAPAPVESTDKVVDLILDDARFRTVFEYEREGETHILPRAAVKEWLKTARFWEIVSRDLLSLTPAGKELLEGDFNNLLQLHLAQVVQNKWEFDLQTIRSRLAELRLASRDWRPDTRNWHKAVNEVAKSSISRSRFGQLVSFLLGIGVVRRDICHLYFNIGQ